MLSSVGSATIGLGLIFAILGFAPAAIIVGVVALVWEGFLFYMEGQA